jgi:hypothetical protein
MSDQMANDTSLFCSDFGDESDLDNNESVASDSLNEKHAVPENYPKSFASAIDDEQSRLFSAVPIRRARAYDFDFKHEVSAALDFELRDNSDNATLSKQELENKNHQCALKRVDYPKTAKFNLVNVKVHDKSGYGHDETFLEESDDETSFGMATVKKVDHDTSKLSFALYLFTFVDLERSSIGIAYPKNSPTVAYNIVLGGNKILPSQHHGHCLNVTLSHFHIFFAAFLLRLRTSSSLNYCYSGSHTFTLFQNYNANMTSL